MATSVFKKRKSITLMKIFWDYESCPCPGDIRITDMIAQIKQTVDDCLQYSVLKEITIYRREESNQINVDLNQSNDSNAHWVVVPRRKDYIQDEHAHEWVYIKQIVADLALTAVDWAEKQENGGICLITENGDFGYILSRLHSKSQISWIILITQNKLNQSLFIQADFVVPLFPHPEAYSHIHPSYRSQNQLQQQYHKQQQQSQQDHYNQQHKQIPPFHSQLSSQLQSQFTQQSYTIIDEKEDTPLTTTNKSPEKMEIDLISSDDEA